MIALPTYVIAVTHMAHSIAGSVDVLYLVVRGAAGWLDYARFLGVSLLGNVIGGVVFVAVINHRQVVAGESRTEESRTGASREKGAPERGSRAGGQRSE